MSERAYLDLNNKWEEALTYVAKHLGIDFSDAKEIPLLLEKESFARIDKNKARDARILIFSGPTGVGKNSICNVLRGRISLKKIPNVFTRPRRPDESAEEFILMTEEEFKKAESDGLFLQINRRHGYFHGLLRSRVDEALASKERYYMDKSVPSTVDLISKLSRTQLLLIYVFPPSFEELVRRIVERNQSIKKLGHQLHDVYENIEERLQTSIREFQEGGHIYDLFVVNDEIQRATARIIDLISGVQT